MNITMWSEMQPVVTAPEKVTIAEAQEQHNRLTRLARNAAALVMTGAIMLGVYADSSHDASAQVKYPTHKVEATVFWVGEPASAANNWISNISTEWEDDARKTFGGFDDPTKRKPNGTPANFKPKEDPFYIALPESEYNNNGLVLSSRTLSPWASAASKLPKDDSQSLLKGRWVEVSFTKNKKTTTAYGQWLDSGPSPNGDAVEDPNYVYGTAPPKNKFGLRAGIDLSPTMAHYLHLGKDLMQASGEVTWHFVDAQKVPKGLWKNYKPIDNRTHWN